MEKECEGPFEEIKQFLDVSEVVRSPLLFGNVLFQGTRREAHKNYNVLIMEGEIFKETDGYP